MSDNNIIDKIITESLGTGDISLRDIRIKNFSPDERKILAEYNNLMSLISAAAVSETEKNFLPDKIKEKLFEKIDLHKNPGSQIPENDFEFKYSGGEGWFQHPEIEGIKVKQLANNTEKGYVMILMKVAAGTKYPAHHHHGAEECYVIEGDVYAQGETLGPGDFHHASGGSDHEPLHTINGCTLLLVIDPADF